MKKTIIWLLSAVLAIGLFCAVVSETAFAEEKTLEITAADIVRSSRSNINRELFAFTPKEEGLELHGVFETEKPMVKAAIKKSIPFADGFEIFTKIGRSDKDCLMDIGILYGDIDESWMDPWDFFGIDMNDPGSVKKFESIGGVTVRFNMTDDSVSTVMMKGMGTDWEQAAFAVAGVTNSLPFEPQRSLSFEKSGEDWYLETCGVRLLPETDATLLNPEGKASAQAFLNDILNGMDGRDVYVYAAMSGADGQRASMMLKGAGGYRFCMPNNNDALLGDVSYDTSPEQEIEFSVAENYYLGLPGYEDTAFTYLSQPYQYPVFALEEKGLRLSGNDRLYGVNADLTYLTPYDKFDGFSSVLSVGEMPRSSSSVNSNISITMNGQKFASYYAWDSIYIKITFPYANESDGVFASVLLWGQPIVSESGTVNHLRAEIPPAYIPMTDTGDIVIKAAETSGNYYIYVNGVRFGDGFETQMNETVRSFEQGYTDADGTHRGFYVSTMNTAANMADGSGLSDEIWQGPCSHYWKQIGGAAIVNDVPTVEIAQAPYVSCSEDVTEESVRFSFSGETPGRADGNFEIDGYIVQRYRGGSLEKTFRLEGADNRTFTDTGLKPSAEYTYIVSAVQGVADDKPIVLVEYQPLRVKTLASAESSAVAAGSLYGTSPLTGIRIGTAAFVIAGIIIMVFVLRNASRRRKADTGYKSESPRIRVRRQRATFSAKRFVAVALCCCMFVGVLSGCSPAVPDTPENPDDSTDIPNQTTEETFLDSIENLTTPFWKNGIMYNETVLMLQDGSSLPKGKLAYAPKRVLRVCDYTLQTIYRENVDYVIADDGTITLTAETDCPYLQADDLFYATRPQGVDGLLEFPSSSAQTPNLMYTETDYLVRKQLCITYEYDISQVDSSAVSQADETKLPALRSMLAQKKTIRMAVLGDSISEGANSSGKLGISPYQPIYPALFRQYLESEYATDIVFENFSMGGMQSAWGAQRAYAVGQFVPDIVILSFGANDGGCGTDNNVVPVSVEEYMRNMTAAMDAIRRYNPRCEFIVVSSLMPNPAGGAFGIQGDYASAVEEFCKGKSDAVSVNMYRLHEYFCKERGKNYIDMSSNNVNHPNDFLIRLYAMNIIGALWN